MKNSYMSTTLVKTALASFVSPAQEPFWVASDGKPINTTRIDWPSTYFETLHSQAEPCAGVAVAIDLDRQATAGNPRQSAQ